MADLPTLVCLCSNVRRASRALTQIYEATLRPIGLRSTQFTILQVLARVGEVTQGRLGEILAMDSTTLTRTLALMLRAGWISERRGNPGRGEDGRERRLRMAKSGEEQLRRALPAWEKVQARLRRELGEEKWRQLSQLTTELAEMHAESVS